MQAKSILEAKGNAVITTRPETVVAETYVDSLSS